MNKKSIKVISVVLYFIPHPFVLIPWLLAECEVGAAQIANCQGEDFESTVFNAIFVWRGLCFLLCRGSGLRDL
jgi:hypothetical protein